MIDGPNQRIVVRSDGQSLTPEAIGQVALRERDGSVLRISDVARVVVAGAPKFGDGAINGEPAIVTVVSAQLGGNTKVVASAVEEALRALAPALEREGITLHADVFRPATFIDLALRNITTSLLLGALLVSVILMLFLADMRTAAISLTAIPLSLLSAIILLEVLGFSINTLTLGGLAIALGEVVDDAIIDVENIARRLRQLGAHGRAPTSATWWFRRRSRCAAAWCTRRSWWRSCSCRCWPSRECRGHCSARSRWHTSSRPLRRSSWP